MAWLANVTSIPKATLKVRAFKYVKLAPSITTISAQFWIKMKLLLTNFWKRATAGSYDGSSGVPSTLLPRMCLCQQCVPLLSCGVRKRNLQSSSNHTNNNNTKDNTKLKVMFFGTDGFALGNNIYSVILSQIERCFHIRNEAQSMHLSYQWR